MSKVAQALMDRYGGTDKVMAHIRDNKLIMEIAKEIAAVAKRAVRVALVRMMRLTGWIGQEKERAIVNCSRLRFA